MRGAATLDLDRRAGGEKVEVVAGFFCGSGSWTASRGMLSLPQQVAGWHGLGLPSSVRRLTFTCKNVRKTQFQGQRVGVLHTLALLLTRSGAAIAFGTPRSTLGTQPVLPTLIAPLKAPSDTPCCSAHRYDVHSSSASEIDASRDPKRACAAMPARGSPSRRGRSSASRPHRRPVRRPSTSPHFHSCA